MKKIRYKVADEHDIQKIEPKSVEYNAHNLALAKTEAYNGEYTIEDDGEPELPTTEQRVSDLEEQLVQADETAIALYEAQEEQESINAQQDEALMEIYEMIG